MDISSLSGPSWFQKLEMNLISAVTSQGAGKVQSAGSALADPANAAGSGATSDATSAAPPPPPPPPAATTSPVADSMLATLIDLQSSQSLASQASSSLIKALDTNGDGQLSMDEVTNAMGNSTTNAASGASSTSPAAQAFAKLDTNGDGQLSADELTKAMQALEQNSQASGAHRGHGHHHHHMQVADAQGAPATTSTNSSSTASTSNSSSSAATSTTSADAVAPTGSTASS